MPVLAYIVVAVAAYLLGSIPFGFLVAKAKGIDIRSVGSGNIGATNAMRVLGKPAGIFVLLLDALKGYIAVRYLPIMVGYAEWVTFDLFNEPNMLVKTNWAGTSIIFEPHHLQELQIIAGIFAVLGHNYTCWLKFKGGKGIATTAGVYLVLAPWALLVGLSEFILAVLLTRYVSIGSIAAAIALPATVWVMSPDNLFLCIVTTALGALAIYKHKSNLQRLMAGTENRLGKKSSTTETTK